MIIDINKIRRQMEEKKSLEERVKKARGMGRNGL